MNKSQKILKSLGHGTMFVGSVAQDLPVQKYLENQEIITFNHSLWPSGRGGGDVGGPFWSSKSWIQAADDNFVVAQGLGRRYEGTLHASPPNAGSVDNLSNLAKPGNFDSVVSAGTTAIARTIPTNPSAGLSVAIGEAREGAPKLISKSFVESILKSDSYQLSRAVKSSGGEYLNYEFGWKPLVRDLLSFSKSVKNSNELLRQLYRNSGPNNSVRRRYRFPEEKSESPIDGPKWGYVAPFMCNGGQLDSWMVSNGPSVGPPSPIGFSFWDKSSTKTWFSGAYSYVMPPPPVDLADKLQTWDAEANKLFGTRITPDTLWNIAPWTWAADWFGNMGDVMTNASALSNDSLVLKYGYIMRETNSSYHSKWQGYVSQPTGGPAYVHAEASYGYTTKLRLQALPFGFGLNIGGLTPKQTAISVAVGMSRSPRISL